MYIIRKKNKQNTISKYFGAVCSNESSGGTLNKQTKKSGGPRHAIESMH